MQSTVAHESIDDMLLLENNSVHVTWVCEKK